MSDGWVSIHRKLFDNPVSTKPNYLAIWIFLITHANHKPSKVIVNNKPLTVKRGQYFGSIKKIADAFTSDDGRSKMSKSTVHRTLEYLQAERMAERNKGDTYSLITILNYDQYQQTIASGTGSGTIVETYNKDNKKISKDIRLKPKKEFGSKEVNQLTGYLKRKMSLPGLDGGAKANRYAASNLIKKYGLEECKGAVDRAAGDEFWSNSLTSIVTLQKHFQKISKLDSRVNSLPRGVGK